MRERRWEGLLRELRKLVFGACCALGALGGLGTGIWTGAELDARGDLADELVSTLKPMLVRFGIGLGAGVAVGLAVCLTILKPRYAASSQVSADG